ncbi:MAG TPA: hypothetical protein VGQ24_03920 [Gemmatimonadales bacterium]|nr:hypothetical protein [Gemmatimonadales bacterium]
MQRIATLWGLAALTMLGASFNTGTMSLRSDSSRAELAKLGQEYGDLQQWVAAIAATSDTLPNESGERARVLADQLARLMRPLENDFERTTASLSTTQLELILPLWERMAFAHAGLVLLQEQAAELGGDPALEPAELRDLADELSAVLDFAAEVQQMVLEQLTTPIPTPIRLS